MKTLLRSLLLSSLVALCTACGGGGGGGDGYLMGGGNEGTGGVNVRSVVISGSVIDEQSNAVHGATAIVNNSIATPITRGQFSVPVPLAEKPVSVQITIDRGPLGSAAVTVDAVDSTVVEEVHALISVNREKATLEGVEVVKRGERRKPQQSVSEELQSIDRTVNAPVGPKTEAAPDAGGPLTRRPELDPDLMGIY